MVQIKQMLLDPKQKNVPNRSMTPKYITVHETANESKGANAYMHARYQRNGSGGRWASWHYTVDDKEIWQSLLDNRQGYHAGDGQGRGNTESIGIELCVNSDGDWNKTVRNGQMLIKYLMNKHNIPIARVVPHQFWSGKNCPRRLLGDWQTFKNGITGGSNVKPQQTVQSPIQTSSKTNSIVDYLKSVGIDSSFNNRSKLANQYGIKNYRGTAEQNRDLLNKLRSEKPPVKKEGSTYEGTSIVDYLKRLGINSSFSNRQALARQYGVANYRGTAEQNLDLLRRMQKGNQFTSSPKPKGDQRTNSIVDYLKSIKVDSSFNNRKKLAAKHGIKNYTGSASQNRNLLNKMRK